MQEGTRGKGHPEHCEHSPELGNAQFCALRALTSEHPTARYFTDLSGSILAFLW